jgi:small subunit ribosomal protein S6
MEKKRTQLYEEMYILNAALSEEAKDKAVEKLKQQILSLGGEIHHIHDWGRRRLAYPIDGKREGHYFILYFTIDTQAMKELWRACQLNEDLIRHMPVCVDKVCTKIEFKPLVLQE